MTATSNRTPRRAAPGPGHRRAVDRHLAARRAGILFGAGGLLLVVLVAAFPIWLPWALQALLGRVPGDYAAFHRNGYAGFRLKRVALHPPGFDFRAESVVVRFNWPTARLEAEIEDWQLAFEPVPAHRRPGPRGPTGPYAAFENTDRILPRLRERLSRVQARGGELTWQGRDWQVPRVEWEAGQLSATINGTGEFTNQTVNFRADLSPPAPYQLRAAIEPFGIALDATVSEQANQWNVSGEATWAGNHVAFGADFIPDLKWPAQARLEAPLFKVPAALLNLETYGVITGKVLAVWQGRDGEERFQIIAAAAAPPVQTNLPPIHVDVEASGNLTQAIVRAFQVQAPGIFVAIDEPFEIRPRGQLISAPVNLRARIDLGNLPVLNSAGRLEGAIIARPSASFVPGIHFDVSGSKLQWGAAVTNTPAPPTFDLRAQGELDWPQLRFETQARVPRRELGLSVDGAFDFQTRQLAQTILVLTQDDSILRLSGAGNIGPTSQTVRVDHLTWTRRSNELYALANPVELSRQGTEWVVGPLDLRGPGRRLLLSGRTRWPTSGEFKFEASGIPLGDFIFREAPDPSDAPGPELQLDSLILHARWDDGPLHYRLDGDFSIRPASNTVFFVNARLAGGAGGLDLESLSVSSDAGLIASADGSAPVILQPKQWPEIVAVQKTQPMRLRAVTFQNRAFWDSLAELTGVRLDQPRLQVRVSGTPAKPQGTISLQAATIHLQKPAFAAKIPKLDQLNLELVLQENQVALHEFVVEIADQPVTVTGSLPLREDFWTRLTRVKKWPDWHQATLRLRIDSAQVAPFVPYLPRLLAPQGQLSVDLALRPGLELDGTLVLTNAATRPLPPLGPIRDLEARVTFQGREAIIEKFSGSLGGEPVVVRGMFHLAESGESAFELTLKGENVPLVRQPGLVLRSDLDVALDQQFGKPAVLSGQLVPRQSVLLQDLNLLAPGRLAAPEQRPPYFRVAEPPLADWKLDLQIAGDRFLQVRNPIFRGVVSANFNLLQTLGDPIALGDARINSGMVRFPFADLTVDQGLVTLTDDNPYEAKLLITASAQAFGYYVKMEVRGTSVEPQIRFSSNPPLTSEEILLMLTAGELPRREYAFTGQQRASQLALFLGRDLLTRFGADEATADRLTIRSGENISEEGNLTHYIELKLTDRLSAVGEYDRFNAFNAGIKIKLYAR